MEMSGKRAKQTRGRKRLQPRIYFDPITRRKYKLDTIGRMHYVN